MLTNDELKSLPLFSTLGPADIIELARVAADINVGPGEYLVHEGDEAALFVVIWERSTSPNS